MFPAECEQTRFCDFLVLFFLDVLELHNSEVRQTSLKRVLGSLGNLYPRSYSGQEVICVLAHRR